MLTARLGSAALLASLRDLAVDVGKGDSAENFVGLSMLNGQGLL